MSQNRLLSLSLDLFRYSVTVTNPNPCGIKFPEAIPWSCISSDVYPTPPLGCSLTGQLQTLWYLLCAVLAGVLYLPVLPGNPNHIRHDRGVGNNFNPTVYLKTNYLYQRSRFVSHTQGYRLQPQISSSISSQWETETRKQKMCGSFHSVFAGSLGICCSPCRSVAGSVGTETKIAKRNNPREEGLV